MRTLIRREPPVRRRTSHDPAPSRAAYRMQRFWLSPWLRWIVTTVMPVCLVVTAAALWVIQPAQQAKLAEVSGKMRAQVEARPEFQIRQMAITGASPVLADAIRERLGLTFPLSWFEIDTVAIHDNVAALDAVAEVRVTVELGGALHVDVREREPAILWRYAGAIEILDATGHRIAFLDSRDTRADLPLITGDGANAAVPEADEMAHHRLRGVEAVEKHRRTAEVGARLPDDDDRRAKLGDRRQVAVILAGAEEQHTVDTLFVEEIHVAQFLGELVARVSQHYAVAALVQCMHDAVEHRGEGAEVDTRQHDADRVRLVA